MLFLNSTKKQGHQGLLVLLKTCFYDTLDKEMFDILFLIQEFFDKILIILQMFNLIQNNFFIVKEQ